MNPCPSGKRAKTPKVTAGTPTRKYKLTPGELGKIARAMDADHRLMLWIAALTSLRWEVCAGLRACEFDLERRTVAVSQAVIRGGAGVGPVISGPKSVASGRLIPLPGELIARVGTVVAERNLEGDALLFPGTSGGPMCDRWFRARRWYPALKVAGLYDATPCRAGFHDLSRAFSAAAVRECVDVTTLQGLMGRADSPTTMNTYPQRSSAVEREASEMVARHLLPIPA